jgi:phospholipase/carboxylesterase
MLSFNGNNTKPNNGQMGNEPLELEYAVRMPNGDTKSPPLLVLFHGHSSNENDLLSFGMHVPDNWLIVSARAPISLGNDSYSWYHVWLEGEKIVINFPEEEVSRQRILKFIDQIVERYGADKRRIVLAGFSQGANMASCVGLTSPRTVAGFACFSGRFVAEIKPLVTDTEGLRSLRAFIAHGNNDKMLPIKCAEESLQALQGYGVATTFSEDNTAHTISANHLKAFLEWLKQF